MQAIKGGPQDPRKYFWNDKYTFNEAGSPYLADYNNGVPPPQNIYELDTIRGGAVPEPSTLVLCGIAAAFGVLTYAGRRRSSRVCGGEL
jgi:hypothetical protein